MSVNPVGFIPMTETAGEQRSSRLASITKSSFGETASPEFGTDPKRKTHDPQGEQQFSELGRDEVQVQRDSQSNYEIVIQYVDRSGNLILQIPSSQVLGLGRAIEQALAEQAKERENAQKASEGGEPRGHQL